MPLWDTTIGSVSCVSALSIPAGWNILDCFTDLVQIGCLWVSELIGHSKNMFFLCAISFFTTNSLIALEFDLHRLWVILYVLIWSIAHSNLSCSKSEEMKVFQDGSPILKTPI